MVYRERGWYTQCVYSTQDNSRKETARVKGGKGQEMGYKYRRK